jgi:hypothetical protein
MLTIAKLVLLVSRVLTLMVPYYHLLHLVMPDRFVENQM